MTLSSLYPFFLGFILTSLLLLTGLTINSVGITLSVWLIISLIIYLWLKKELTPQIDKSSKPLGARELKQRLSFQSSLLDFYLDSSKSAHEFTQTRIWPLALNKHHVVVSQQWWEQTPSFYRTIALLYLHEFARALNDSLLWRLWWDLRALLRKGILVTELRPFRKKIHKRLKTWHGIDEEWVALFEARYLKKSSS